MIELLKRHRILICAGTGGVGKTSMSASLGVLAAREGLKTLVLTIDPALRLAQALGIESKPGEEVQVPGLANLYASMIDPRKEFDQFVLGSVDNTIARGLFNNRLYQQLASNLNGSQEFTSLVRLLRASKASHYDLIILDTPPTQNAVDFLRAPDRLYALFQDTVIGWFANPNRDESWLKRTLHRGTRLVTSALESVTGSTFIQELKDFFTHVAYLKDQIAEVSRDTNSLLRNEVTGFVLVTGFDESKLKEALEFQNDLKLERLRLSFVIVNRWFPEWEQRQDKTGERWASHPDFRTLDTFHKQFSQYFETRQSVFADFKSKLGATVPVLRLPDYKNTVQGLEDLNEVANTLQDKWRSLT